MEKRSVGKNEEETKRKRRKDGLKYRRMSEGRELKKEVESVGK